MRRLMNKLYLTSQQPTCWLNNKSKNGFIEGVLGFTLTSRQAGSGATEIFNEIEKWRSTSIACETGFIRFSAYGFRKYF